ncbi:MAG: DUF3109 family protein [Lentimicrobiaceae bacterium]|jgi:hypothetical protein|nr:DUF3109 family protein [Lentimicrobiaceae bacterium]MCP4910981.1 DUF3109 family protein [Bacteroidota bacterium]MBT3454342.1 DUF3109 family protein [Lentimicrobiaceae bacterium]MBT3817934.1 DUF3109 family protein [Lentimicrobiaceae bacterium]MBT4189850.1 DUF3109 family protein [Lentimicrobiaceae bacterium]
MIIVDNILVSDEIKDVFFECSLTACKGECCVAGDAGAPLDEEEISTLEDDVDEIMPYMSEKGKQVIKENGVFEYDVDGTYVTPLVNDEECAFVYFKDDISFCSIEKAYNDGKIGFHKPISCHLYPVRLSKVGNSIAINYHRWDICSPAIIAGKKAGIPLYEYLKIPLIRRFGDDWYKNLKLRIDEPKRG